MRSSTASGSDGSGERLLGEIGERRPPPERGGLAEGRGRRLGIALGGETPALSAQPLEHVQVQLTGVHPHQVAGLAGLDPAPALVVQRSSQPRDGHVHCMHGALRRRVGPQLVHQRVHSDDAVRVQ
jgi:hypothetical protein